MSPLLISTLCLAMVGTSFLSGIFGMAGGMILVGILLAILPVPEAMMLHGVTQTGVERLARTAVVSACSLERDRLLRVRLRDRAAGVVVHALRAEHAGRAAAARRDAVHGPAGAEGLRPNPESLLQGAIYGVALHDADPADRRRRPADRHVLPRRQARPARDRRHQGGVPDLRSRREAHLFRRLIDQAARSIRSSRRSRSSAR